MPSGKDRFINLPESEPTVRVTRYLLFALFTEDIVTVHIRQALSLSLLARHWPRNLERHARKGSCRKHGICKTVANNRVTDMM